MENDMSINTGVGLNDGGSALDQNDIQSFIKVLIEQRNDALDNLAIFRTKCVRYVATLTSMGEAINKLNKDNADLTAKVQDLETQLDSLKPKDKPVYDMEASLNSDDSWKDSETVHTP